jgi:hypothetical protein
VKNHILGEAIDLIRKLAKRPEGVVGAPGGDRREEKRECDEE